MGAEALKDYAAGMAAGLATVIVGHPFDTVKVNLQAKDSTFKGPFHATRHILQSQGVRGLYKGATSSFIGMAAESSVLFGAYTQVKKQLQAGKPGDASLAVTYASGGIAGAAVSFILCPTELVKCRLQVQAQGGLGSATALYKGPLDCLLKTVKTEGMGTLYRGFVPTLIRESFGNACFFTTYEVVKWRVVRALGGGGSHVGQRAGGGTRELEERGVSEALRGAMIEGASGLVSGGIAGMVFWATVLPFDVVKTRMQTAREYHNRRQGLLLEFSTLWREAGVRGLYSGLSPTLARAFPANAAAIVAWELVARILVADSAKHQRS